MNYKIAQLIITPGQKTNATCEVFISQPDANKENLAGKIFTLIEIDSKRADDLKVVNFLINNLNYNYYQNEKMILRERLSNIKIEHIFESALAKTNKKLIEFLQSERIKLNSNSLNITVGVICQDGLHFSNLGKNKAIMIYRNKPETKEKYKLADITEQTRSEIKKQINLVKLFSNVVSGSIPSGGYFIFTNEALPEYLSSKQLTEIITTLPPAGAVEQIKNILAKINDYIPFLGIIIKNTVGQETVELKLPVKAPTSTKSSFENLNETEATTEKLLSPSGLINLKKWGFGLNKLTGRLRLPTFAMAKNEISVGKKPYWSSLVKVANFLKNILLSLINLLFYLYSLATNKHKIIETYHNGKDKIKRTGSSFKHNYFRIVFWFKNLSARNKTLLVGLAMVCLIFLANLIWLGIKNKSSENQQLYDNLIKTIDQKQNQIDASLLYNNDTGAKNIIEEVKQLLGQLPTKTKEQQTLYNKFLTKDTAQREKIDHVIRIEQPTELANYKNLNSQADPTNLILVRGMIYAADAGQKSIYSLDLNSKLITAITDIKQPMAYLNSPVADDKDRIYYLNDNNIIMLDTKTKVLSGLTIAYPAAFNKIAAMDTYSNRLYLLVPENNQIYRYNRTNDSFSIQTTWLTEKTDLQGAVDLAIDGNIYLLNSDGRVMKFLKGKKQTFDLESIDPLINQAAKISISQEQKYIYLLEPAEKRLVVFDKTGTFLSQYTADQFTKLKDFIVDESAKKIYFLNDTSVFMVGATHFEQ